MMLFAARRSLVAFPPYRLHRAMYGRGQDFWRERLTQVSIGLVTRMLRKFARLAFRFRSFAVFLCTVVYVKTERGSSPAF